MLEKIIIIGIRIGVLLILVGGLVYSGLYLWKRQSFLNKEGIVIVNNSTNDKESDGKLVDSSSTVVKGSNNIGVLSSLSNGDNFSEENKANDSVESKERIDDKDEDDMNDSKEEDIIIPAIKTSDCQDDCKNRLGKELEYKYCREICGFNNNTNNVNSDEEEENCDDIEDTFEEDVCWKNKAIKESNIDYCKELYSEDLAKICREAIFK